MSWKRRFVRRPLGRRWRAAPWHKRCALYSEAVFYLCKLTCLKMCTQIIGLLSTSENSPQSHHCFGFHVFFSSEGWIEKSLRPSRLNKTLWETRCLNSNLRGGQQLVRDENEGNYTLNLRSPVLHKQTSVCISSRAQWSDGEGENESFYYDMAGSLLLIQNPHHHFTSSTFTLAQDPSLWTCLHNATFCMSNSPDWFGSVSQ